MGFEIEGATLTHRTTVKFTPIVPFDFGNPTAMAPDDCTYICYDPGQRGYHILMPTNRWVFFPKPDAKLQLMYSYNYWGVKPDDGGFSQVDKLILKAQQQNAITKACEVAGYPQGIIEDGSTRILVTSSPKFIEAAEGDWSMLEGIFTGMFGRRQLQYFYAWIKLSLEMYTTVQWIPGPILVLAGPPQSGKSLLLTLLQALFGGRPPGQPFEHITGATRFNSELVGPELLIMDDDLYSVKPEVRQAIAAQFKKMAVSLYKRVESKHGVTLSMKPLQRCVVCVNDEFECLSALPPIQPGIADKIMLFKIDKQEMPRSTKTPKEQQDFLDELHAQLPAFVHYLQNWEIPEKLQENRTGMKCYHDPDILEILRNGTSQGSLLSLIEDAFPTNTPLTNPLWRGKAVELASQLLDHEVSSIKRRAERILHNPGDCPYILRGLAKDHPKRVCGTVGHTKTTIWTVWSEQYVHANVPGPSSNEKVVEFLKKMKSAP